MSRPDPARLDEVLRLMLRTAADDLAATERPALADEPDGLHAHRVRVRRLRSILAASRDHLDRPAAERLRVLYAEWGRQLGTARDIEVRAAAAETALTSLGVTDGGPWRRLVDDERAEYSRAHARIVDLAASERADERERALQRFLAEPGIVDPSRPADEVLAQMLRRQVKRVRRRARKRDGTLARDHELRKAARRVRYVAEAASASVARVAPREVAALAASGEDAQDALGDHRDAITFAERVTRARALAAHAGEAVQVYDELDASSRAAAEDALAGLDEALEAMFAAAAGLR